MDRAASCKSIRGDACRYEIGVPIYFQCAFESITYFRSFNVISGFRFKPFVFEFRYARCILLTSDSLAPQP
jgi:hypothetical protein